MALDLAADVAAIGEALAATPGADGVGHAAVPLDPCLMAPPTMAGLGSDLPYEWMKAPGRHHLRNHQEDSMAHRISAPGRRPIAFSTWVATPIMMWWLSALLAVALLPLAIVIGIGLASDQPTLDTPASEAAPAAESPQGTVPAATQAIEDAPHIEYHG